MHSGGSNEMGPRHPICKKQARCGRVEQGGSDTRGVLLLVREQLRVATGAALNFLI